MNKKTLLKTVFSEGVANSLHEHQGSLTTLFALLPLLLVLTACQSVPEITSEQPCPPRGYSRIDLAQLKQDNFEIPSDKKRATLAMALVACLGDPDPALRDDIVYASYSKWLRARLLPDDTVRTLRTALLGELTQAAPDMQGFRRPFAALALAEVARVDRVTPLFNDRERNELILASVGYMSSIEDYRGFDEIQGWRHGVAHTADLMLQLCLNDAISTQQMQQMLSALAQQVAPQGEHFYIYGEPERLARPILFMARRGAFSTSDWTRWLEAVGSPSPFANWDEVWSSQQGFAKLHNTKAFAQAVYVNASASENSGVKSLLPGVVDLLKRLP